MPLSSMLAKVGVYHLECWSLDAEGDEMQVYPLQLCMVSHVGWFTRQIADGKLMLLRSGSLAASVCLSCSQDSGACIASC